MKPELLLGHEESAELIRTSASKFHQGPGTLMSSQFEAGCIRAVSSYEPTSKRNRSACGGVHVYSSSEYDVLPAVVYDFAEGRGGQHARDFLGSWSGKLVCDDYSGYQALFERGVVEVGCMAHVRRKFHDLYANHSSELAEEALHYFAALYEIERLAREQKLDMQGRLQLRQQRSKPIVETLRQWLTRQRGRLDELLPHRWQPGQ
jgi:transposase